MEYRSNVSKFIRSIWTIYTVTITDANGCNAIISDSITQSTNSINAVLNSVNGTGCDSLSAPIITSVVSGGTSPFTYLWSNGATTASVNISNIGNYILTVTDSIGCSMITSLQVTYIIQPIRLNALVTQPNCTNGQSGSINLNVSGGVPQYSYVWSHGAQTAEVANLIPGTYLVTVTDSSGC